MTRTIRHRSSWAWWRSQPYSCKVCGRTHGITEWDDPRVPHCADGKYNETSQNRMLKEERRDRSRAKSKAFIQAFKEDKDIENIVYPCNKDIRIDWYLT